MYGCSGEFRAACRALSLAYVVIIPCDYRSPSRKTRSSALTRPYQMRYSSGGHAGTGRKAPLQRLGADRRRGPAGVPADPAAALAGEEPVHLLPVLGAGRRPRHHDLLHHHRRAPLARGGNLQTGNDTLGWDISQARTYDAICRHTALTALAQLRAAAIRAALAGAAILPGADGGSLDTAHAATGNTVTADDLHFYPGGAPEPARGQPCPPGIPPIELSDAETPISSARDWKAGLITRARLAFRLRWSHWRRRHQARARWHHYSTRLQALTTGPAAGERR